ncbi:hypothetical protein Tco_1058207 [Tanacetum coccineum]|uniref:CCHC-type domain-containing protein n=1 Tax=Tanacetum coccineum TaxID=301880 RepID=A0ABQ5H952_9ASTR
MTVTKRCLAHQEPFVVNQDPGKNSSQSPPQIDHNCCYECGNSLDDIFCLRCTCKSCGNGAHIGYNCPPKAPIIFNPEQCTQTIDELPQTLPSVHPTCNSGDENSFTYDSKPNSVDDSPNKEEDSANCGKIKPLSLILEGKIPICYNDDDDELISLSRSSLVNSLLSLQIPPGIVKADLDPKEDIRFIENLMYDNSFSSPSETLKDDYEIVIDSNNDYFLSDDDSYENIYYVDASTSDAEIVWLRAWCEMFYPGCWRD